MINGKLNGFDFLVYDGNTVCDDAHTKGYIDSMYEFILVGFQPQDGDPELYLLDMLEKSGAKDLKHTEEPEEKGVVY